MTVLLVFSWHGLVLKGACRRSLRLSYNYRSRTTAETVRRCIIVVAIVIRCHQIGLQPYITATIIKRETLTSILPKAVGRRNSNGSRTGQRGRLRAAQTVRNEKRTAGNSNTVTRHCAQEGQSND